MPHSIADSMLASSSQATARGRVLRGASKDNFCAGYKHWLTELADVCRLANSNDREEPDMAIQSAIPVSFDAYFPKGAFMVGEVEPVVKWSDDGQRQG